MKTSKQIQILKEQKGAALSAKISNNDYDVIQINAEKSKAWFPNLNEDTSLVCTPVVKTGLLIVDYESFNGYTLFDTEFKDDNFLIKVDAFNNFNSEFVWDCSVECEMPYIIKPHVNGNIVEYKDAITEVYKKQKRKQKEIDDYIVRVIEETCRPLELLMRTMSYINWLMQNPEYKEIEVHHRESNGKHKKNPTTKNSGIKNTTPKNKIIKINNIKFKTTNTNIVTGLKTKKKRMSLGSWGVRGHFRHYKDGKIVYIKPYTKGRGHKIDNKKYLV